MVEAVVTQRNPSRPISTSRIPDGAVKRMPSLTTVIPSAERTRSRSRASLYAPNIRSFRDCGNKEPVKNAAFVGAIVGVHQSRGMTGLGPSWFVLPGAGGGVEHVAAGTPAEGMPAGKKPTTSLELCATSVPRERPAPRGAAPPDFFPRSHPAI